MIATYTMTDQDVEGTVPFTIDFTSTGGTAGLQVTTTTNSSSVVYDKTIPVINSISRQIPLAETTSANTVTWRILFSEPVLGVDLNDFQLTQLSGTVNGTLSTITTVGTSGTTLDVTVNNITGEGTLRLDLKGSGTGIMDLTGNCNWWIYPGPKLYHSTGSCTARFCFSDTGNNPAMTVPTKDKPQSKVWNYAGKWWTALSVSGGTKIFRLDNTTWTAVLTLTATNGRCDIRQVGNLVHILIYKGAENNS